MKPKPKRKRVRIVKGWVTLRGNEVCGFHQDLREAKEYVTTCNEIKNPLDVTFGLAKCELRFKV